MIYFEKLIEKIDDIEDNFNVINSRIIEFGESTDYKHIDLGLVNKYNKVLISYIDFLSKEKEKLGNNIEDIDNISFEATKKITEKRITILEDKLRKLQKQVSKINDIKKDSLSEKDIKEQFESSSEMENLKKLLFEFKEGLNIYKKIQNDIGIKVDLNDKIEKEIEQIGDNEDVILTQNEYIDNYSQFLEEILNTRNKNIDLISKKTEIVFKMILENDLYYTEINKIFDKKYIVGLKLEESKLYSDNKEFVKFNENIDLLLDISKFYDNYDLVLESAKYYGLEKLILKYFDLKNDLKYKILDFKTFDLEKLILKIDNNFGIIKLKTIFKYFEGFVDLIDAYKGLKSINFDVVNEAYAGAFSRIFITTEKIENIVSRIIQNISSILLLQVSNENIEENISIFIEKTDLLNKLYYGLVSSNVKIKFSNYPFVLSQVKREIKNFLFVYKGEKYYDELIGYYNQASNNKHRNDRVRHISNNSYSSGGYSSGGGSWSSGSSSGSSSYSSSGSSSW